MRHLRPTTSWLLICTFSALLTLLAGCQSTTPTAPEQASLRQLLVLIDQRLVVAPLVAKAKWNSGAPIDDPVRETSILDAVSKQATEAGLDAAFARDFFQSQFDAGKLIQSKLHERWRLAGQTSFSDTVDLGRDVRPVLDRLNPQIIAALRAVYPLLHRPTTIEFIDAQGKNLVRGDADGAARDIALRPLIHSSPAS